MILEGGLQNWLSEKTWLECYWMNRPESANTAVVYRCLSPGMVESGLIASGINEDSYSISIYHTNPEVGKALADGIKKSLHYFSGDLGGYPVQFIKFSGGFDRQLASDGRAYYEFNRDFIINH